MKRLFLLFGIALIATTSFSQTEIEQQLSALEANDSIMTPDSTVSKEVTVEVKTTIDTKTKTNVDTTIIRLGKRNVVVIEKEDGSTTVEIPDRKSYTEYTEVPKFKGHWSGFEWGFNGFLTPNHSTNMTGDLKYLELKQSRSWNFNLNLFQQSIGFGTDKAGLVTGLGFEWNNYHFRNQITISKDPISGITGVDSSYLNAGYKVNKSRLQTTHLVIPLLLEFQIPVQSHRIFISAGVLGGVRLFSNTKVEYEFNGEKKDKVKDDFNLSPFRYGLTARIGYRGLKLFANYYPTSLFEKDKGPEVNPFSVGLILLSFR
jgi:hypothetical protein